MDERLLREIEKSNPWWHDRKEKVYAYRRHAFSTLSKYMQTRQVVAVVGLRRVGKTVLLKQLLHSRLPDLKPRNVFFFSFEERWGNTEVLEDVIYHFLDNVSGEGEKLVFLDEIQKVDGWEDVIKRFYDRETELKFILSGSSAPSISKGKESLAGRIFDFYLPPLTFKEFLEMNNVTIEAREGLDFSNLRADFSNLRAGYEETLYLKDRIMGLFMEYVYKGGFPEIAKENDEEIIRKYVRNSVVDRIVLRDLPDEFDIKKKEALMGILEYAARETSQLYTNENIASFLGINNETASNYVFYLKEAFLVTTAMNYTKSIVKQLRASKKIHITLPSMAIAIESYGREVLGYSDIMGRYIESLIVTSLKHRYKRVSFWRTPQKEEVDIVMEKNKEIIPIEVKYRNQITKKDVKSLRKFMKKFKVKRGIVITKDMLKEEKDILYIPAWLFLLLDM